jgi:4-hydroxy-3-methylbut-2-en-1-yl diphosphate reductase
MSSYRSRRKGRVSFENLDEVPDGAMTIFSAHGVPREVQREAKLRSLPTIDATCPLVAKAHIQGRRYIAAGAQELSLSNRFV